MVLPVSSPTSPPVKASTGIPKYSSPPTSTAITFPSRTEESLSTRFDSVRRSFVTCCPNKIPDRECRLPCLPGPYLPRVMSSGPLRVCSCLSLHHYFSSTVRTLAQLDDRTSFFVCVTPLTGCAFDTTVTIHCCG